MLLLTLFKIYITVDVMTEYAPPYVHEKFRKIGHFHFAKETGMWCWGVLGTRLRVLYDHTTETYVCVGSEHISDGSEYKARDWTGAIAKALGMRRPYGSKTPTRIKAEERIEKEISKRPRKRQRLGSYANVSGKFENCSKGFCYSIADRDVAVVLVGADRYRAMCISSDEWLTEPYSAYNWSFAIRAALDMIKNI